MRLFVVILALSAAVVLGSTAVLLGASGTQGLAAGTLLASIALACAATLEARAFAGFCRASCNEGDGSLLDLCTPAR